MEDISNGVDVHQYTADIIGCSRQEAKAHTFKPLYGGIMGNENEKRYYKKFLEKYKDIALWHQNLEQRAIKYKLISIPVVENIISPMYTELNGVVAVIQLL